MSRDRQGPLCWSFAHTVRIDEDDNIWAVDKGSDMIIRFNPDGRVVGSSAAARNRRMSMLTPGTRSAAAARGRPVPQPDRRHWDQEATLYQRRLTSIPRRQDRQAGNWCEVWARRASGPANSARPYHRADRNNNIYSATAQPAHPGVRYRGQVPAHVHHRRAAGSPEPCHQRQHPNRRAPGAGDRAPNSIASRPAEPGDVCRRIHLSGASSR